LVKHKDTGLYLLLYIHSNYKRWVRYSWENNKKKWGKHKKALFTT